MTEEISRLLFLIMKEGQTYLTTYLKYHKDESSNLPKIEGDIILTPSEVTNYYSNFTVGKLRHGHTMQLP